jgi:uncharacterized membrane protein SpoIIM required for sporulation
MAPYMGVAVVLFLSVAIIGGAVRSENLGVHPPLGRVVPEYYAQVETNSLFVHNASIALRTVVSVFLFGIPAIWILLSNGFFLGAAVRQGLAEVGAGTTLLLLFPHGIFEIPAILLSGALAFRIMHEVWRVANGRGLSGVAETVFDVGCSLLAVLILLAIAAWVEANLTYEIYRLVTEVV